MPSVENGFQPLERVTRLCSNIAYSKLFLGVTYGAEAYIYRPATITDMELSSPQCLLLALLNSLVTGDVTSCFLLANVCHQFQQLRSRYLKIWLAEDFVFPKKDIEKAMALLIKLEAGALKIPSHVMGIMSSLAIKYGITGFQLTLSSEEDHNGLAIKMENAVSRNNPGDIITLASEGCNVDGLTQSGDSLLHMAVRTGSCASIAALSYLKANLECLGSANATPLEVAVKNNNVSSVKALLMAGAKVDKRLYRGESYLHIAAVGGHNKTLNALLEEGLDVNIKNHLGETPLFQAARAGNVQGVEILLGKGADVSSVPAGSKSLVEIAIESQNIAMFKAFMNDRALAEFYENGDTILHLAARSGNIEVFKIIKNRRLPAITNNQNGITPLHVASNPSIAGLLLGMGVDVDIEDSKGSTALMIMAKDSKVDMVTFLLHSGANPNVKDHIGWTPLHYAAKGGCLESMTALLDAGGKVDEKDNAGCTPAFIAAVNNKINVVKLLLEHGVDLAIRDSSGKGIIHHAASKGNTDIVSLILDVDAGVVVDMKGIGDRTALHCAAEAGHAPVVSVLLNHGADQRAMTQITCDQTPPMQLSSSVLVRPSSHRCGLKKSFTSGTSYDYDDESDDEYEVENTRSNFSFKPHIQNNRCLVDGWTPLIAASKQGSLDVVKLLIDNGAPINDRDIQNKMTALGWANTMGHRSVSSYLLGKGGVE